MVDFSKVFKNAGSSFATGARIGMQQARLKEQVRRREDAETERLEKERIAKEEKASKERALLRQKLIDRTFDATEKAKTEQEKQQKESEKSRSTLGKNVAEANQEIEKDDSVEFNRDLLTKLSSGLKDAGFDAFASRKKPKTKTFSRVLQAQPTTQAATTPGNFPGLQAGDKQTLDILGTPTQTSKPTQGNNRGQRIIEKVNIGEEFLQDAATKAIKGGKLKAGGKLSVDEAFDILLGGATKDLTPEDIEKGRELARKLPLDIRQRFASQKFKTIADKDKEETIGNLDTQVPQEDLAQAQAQGINIPASRGSEILSSLGLSPQDSENVSLKGGTSKKEEPFDQRVLINTNLAEEEFLKNPILQNRSLTPQALGVLNTLRQRQTLTSVVLNPLISTIKSMGEVNSKQGLISAYRQLLNELINEGLEPESRAVKDLIDELD